MRLTDWLLGREPTQLKLQDTGYGKAKIGMPKAPPLDVSLDNLLRYSRRSELVYACIEKKAQAATDAEVVVEKRNKGEWEPIDGHPLVSLLNKPNPWDDGESFIRSWVASENFADNFYCEIVRSGAGVPVGLYPLNPVYLIPQYVSRQGWEVLDHYVYYAGGRPIRYEIDELLIRRRHGLSSVYSDVSAVQIALGSVDADAAATDYVRAFFNNGGEPSGILVNKGRRLTDAEAQAMQQKWTQRYGRGGANRGGVAVIDSEAAEYQVVGSKLNELNSEALDGKIETRICMAFGVPPVLIGAYVGLRNVNQRASFKGALEEFWINTMSPELKSIRTFMTWNLLPMFESIDAIKKGDIRVNWNLSNVMALQPDMDAVVKRTVSAYQGGILKLNEARADLKLDTLEGDEQELGESFYKQPVPTVQFGQMPEPPTIGDGKEPKQITDGKNILDADLLEKKTFDYNGLALGREPTPLEKTIDLKGMVADFDAGREKMAKVLIVLRGELIKQAEGAIGKIKPANVHELILTPPDKAYSRVQKVVDALFVVGENQIKSDLALQKDAKGLSTLAAYETKDIADEWRKFLSKIVDRTISRVINEIQTRAINFFVTRGLLDRDDEETIRELRAALEDQSTKAFEDFAQQTANSAIGAGRDSEIEARSDEWETVEYSAILDANTCDVCEDADGEQGKASSDLPDAPNPDCEGGARCRCFHVAIFKEENA